MRIHPVVLTLVLSLSAPTVASASPCLTAPDSVARFRTAISLLYGPADSVATVAAGLPWARFANIQIVTNSTVCAAAVAAYHATGTHQASAVYVFALRGTGYALVLPGQTAVDRRRAVYVFTPAWVNTR